MSNVKRSRNHTLYLRITDKEYESFEQNRIQCGMTKTDYFLHLLSTNTLVVVPIKEDLQRLIHELKKQGVNLNQIAYSLNQNPYAFSSADGLICLQKQNHTLTQNLLTLFEQVTII